MMLLVDNAHLFAHTISQIVNKYHEILIFRLNIATLSKEILTLKEDAKAGGDIAGGARKNLEKRLGRSVVSGENYIDTPESKKRLER